MKNSFFYFLSISILFYSCSTAFNVYDLQTKSTIVKQHEPFRVFSYEDEINLAAFDNLGNFEFKDAGFTLDCNYSTLIKIAKDKARGIGANGIKIVEYKFPDSYSTCHRFKGYFLYSDNMWQYENEIIWSAERSLEFRDFRDSTFDKSLVSTTMSGFKFEFKSIPIKGQIQLDVATFFNPNESFINSTDTSILNLQQLHFDASELYSRVFINRILKECKSIGELETKYQKIYNEVQAELRGIQSDISNNAYRNIDERKRLVQLIQDGLNDYKAFYKDTYFMPI